MTKTKGAAAFLFIAGLAATPLWTARLAAQSTRAKEVGMKLKCMCRGCDMPAGNCSHPGGAFSGPCDTAKAELRDIEAQLAQGKNEQQILDSFVAQYTTAVLTEPPKRGVGLLAWLMPILYTVVGLALVMYVVNKWRHRPSGAAAITAASPQISPEALARARAQAAHDTED